MSNRLTDIELDSVQITDVQARVISQEAEFNQCDIETQHGTIHVMVQGTPKKPAIITYHDIGLNSVTGFQGFFTSSGMKSVLENFCVFHVNAPGQQPGASPLPIDYVYPTMDQLAEMLGTVMEHFHLKSYIGFGIGAGANILARFALKQSNKVNALVLINCASGKAGWIEWAFQKYNAWYLRSGQNTPAVQNYLLEHWFGKETIDINHDLVLAYSKYTTMLIPQNLGFFIQAYIARTDLDIQRVTAANHRTAKTISCPVLLLTGEHSPHLQDTIETNTRLDPSTCIWNKFDCGGLILEEAGSSVCQAFILFLQGMGYVSLLER